MEIANPIYDAVFKFLLEDKKAATLIIGAITGFDITDVELRPTEVALDDRGERQWTVYRLDLLAHVRTSDGIKAVITEGAVPSPTLEPQRVASGNDPKPKLEFQNSPGMTT